jgi:hypothetical protein
MNQNSTTSASTKSHNNQPNQGGNSPVTLIAIVIGVIVVGAVAYKAMHKGAQSDSQVPAETVQASATSGKSKVVEPREPTATASSASATPAPTSSTVAPAANQPVTGPAKDLVMSLASLDPKKGPITKEQVEKFKNDLKALVAQGSGAVPAIREFLERNVELSYASNGGESVGFSSLRSSLIDALQQIGGPEATQALLATLQTTALPSELAQLARALDQIQPGQFTTEIVTAARQTLDLAITGGLGKEDAGPLFDILGKNLGTTPDPGILNDLKKASQNYKWYPVLVLANAGDAGIDTLVQMAKDPNAPNTIAEVLGQKAWENPKALDALTQMARDGKISPSQWQQIVSLVSGDQYVFQDQIKANTQGQNNQNFVDCQYFHIEWNNQNFSKCKNPNFDPTKGIDAMNKLLGATTDPNVRNALQDRIKTLQAGGR